MSNCPKCGAKEYGTSTSMRRFWLCGSQKHIDSPIYQSTQCKQNQKDQAMSKIDWTKPVRIKDTEEEMVVYRRIGNGETDYPILGSNGSAYTEEGLYNINGMSIRDLENVPDPPKPEPLNDEQMGWMVGKIVKANSTGSLTTVRRFHYDVEAVISLEGCSLNASELTNNYTWPDKNGKPGEPIDSHHLPTPIDFNGQHTTCKEVE